MKLAPIALTATAMLASSLCFAELEELEGNQLSETAIEQSVATRGLPSTESNVDPLTIDDQRINEEQRDVETKIIDSHFTFEQPTSFELSGMEPPPTAEELLNVSEITHPFTYTDTADGVTVTLQTDATGQTKTLTIDHPPIYDASELVNVGNEFIEVRTEPTRTTFIQHAVPEEFRP